MGVTAGTDYAIARKTTWIFPGAGIGPATAVLTRRTLFLFPHRAFSGHGNVRSRTTFTIGGQSPVVAIEALLAAPDTTPDGLEAQLRRWAADVQGPVVEDLQAYLRVRVFTGWLRRSVAFSKKASGYDLRPESVRPTKLELPAFLTLLSDRPGVEIK
ncbi:MAG: hypothetical protein H6709_20685 [Kofleriaceae bacterium]|nr:hypothetical protein [Myxococcales bacterium]MCB9560738.1 hypothetical protein [Kofleriaceae bacterium]MCB9574500.1 hypothetical protein [Kofleriaceae bacterium]